MSGLWSRSRFLVSAFPRQSVSWDSSPAPALTGWVRGLPGSVCRDSSPAPASWSFSLSFPHRSVCWDTSPAPASTGRVRELSGSVCRDSSPTPASWFLFPCIRTSRLALFAIEDCKYSPSALRSTDLTVKP